MLRLITLLTFIIGNSCLAAEPNEEQDDAFRTVILGYRANIEGFDSFECRFDYYRSYSETVEDALQGRHFEDRTIHYDGFLAVDGKSKHYYLHCTHSDADQPDPDSIQNFGTSSKASVKCTSEEYLSSERYSLFFGPGTKTGHLFNDEMHDHGIEVTPFTLGIMGSYGNTDSPPDSPPTILEGVLNGRYAGKYFGITERNGRRLLSIKVGQPKEHLRMHYQFDPERGFLPVWFSDWSPRTKSTMYEAHILEVKEYSRNRWFPMKSVVVWEPQNKPPYQTEMIVVKDLKVDISPNPEAFRVELPAESYLSILDLKAFFTTKEKQTIDRSKLDELYQKCIDENQARIIHGSDRAGGPPQKRRLWFAIAICINGIILALIVFFWLRRRSA